MARGKFRERQYISISIHTRRASMQGHIIVLLSYGYVTCPVIRMGLSCRVPLLTKQVAVIVSIIPQVQWYAVRRGFSGIGNADNPHPV